MSADMTRNEYDWRPECQKLEFVSEYLTSPWTILELINRVCHQTSNTATAKKAISHGLIPNLGPLGVRAKPQMGAVKYHRLMRLTLLDFC